MKYRLHCNYISYDVRTDDQNIIISIVGNGPMDRLQDLIGKSIRLLGVFADVNHYTISVID